MRYKFTDEIVDNENFILEESDKIHPCLLKNNRNDIIKALEFLSSDEKFLYLHGFLGTGKRQFVEYICEYLSNEVIKLEYFCKEATVCDDILLSFTDLIEKSFSFRNFNNNNAKITTLISKFQQMVITIKKPILIILHTVDNVSDSNWENTKESFLSILKEENIKIIITTHAMKTNLLGDIEENRKIFLKAFTQDIFKDFIAMYNIKCSDKQAEDFYALTRGYYFYTALSVKIMQTLNMNLSDFMQKIKAASTSFDSYLGEFYISLIPIEIRNFFWFLKAIRHGLSFNALAVLELFDEITIQYLKANLIVFQSDEIIYLHDYFAQRVDMIIPEKTQIKLHKYIIGIYENQLKESLNNRAILISRQALRAEIDYHSYKIQLIESGGNIDSASVNNQEAAVSVCSDENNSKPVNNSVADKMAKAKMLESEDKITEAISILTTLIDSEEINLTTLVELRLSLARLYKQAGDLAHSLHYFELVESYYKNNKELINLNYLHYEMTELYYKMYKHERAIETIKTVIYSVDTPQSLMVSSCTLLGNIYTDMNNPDEAFAYYQKALDSLDENVDDSILCELYFKFALANDDRGNINLAYEYYNRCISITKNNNYIALAYSNLASCYYESDNIDDALSCFIKAYDLEKNQNNYDGIYYTASHIAEIYYNKMSTSALKYLLEAKQSAEFLNEAFYMIKSTLALGDYYYNLNGKKKAALNEYFKAKQIAVNSSEDIEITIIDKRIKDMKLRMSENDYMEISSKYE